MSQQFITPYTTIQVTIPQRYIPQQIVGLSTVVAKEFLKVFQLPFGDCPRLQILKILTVNGYVDSVDDRLTETPVKYLIDADRDTYKRIFGPLGIDGSTLSRWNVVNFFISIRSTEAYIPSIETVQKINEFWQLLQAKLAPPPIIPLIHPTPIQPVPVEVAVQAAADNIAKIVTTDALERAGKAIVMVRNPDCYQECFSHPEPHESRERLFVGKVRYQYPVTAKLSDTDIMNRRWNVYSHIAKIYGHDLKIIDAMMVERVFDSIDAEFFDGYLRRTIVAAKKSIQFEVSDRMTSTAGKMYSAYQNKPYILRLSRAIFSKIFTNPQENVLKADLNVLSSTRLGCFMATMEHEIIHLLMYIAPGIDKKSKDRKKGPYTSHGKCFQELGAAIFNHNGIHHYLLTGDIDAKNETDADKPKREDFKVGDKVRVQYSKGQTGEGFIVKMNQKTAGIVREDYPIDPKTGNKKHQNAYFVHLTKL